MKARVFFSMSLERLLSLHTCQSDEADGCRDWEHREVMKWLYYQAAFGLYMLYLLKIVGCRDYTMVLGEYYEQNYRKEDPYYKYSGEDSYMYEDESRWRPGRSTFFNEYENGSCGYGPTSADRGTGSDIAAISDEHFEYHDSCGRCFEVKCRPMEFYDRYGKHIQRFEACYDTNKIITVSITDVCPCVDPLPWNYENNKRWCCGDMEHFDLSNPAFAKLADHKWGVIGTHYRPVDCPTNEYERRHHYEDHKKPGYAEKIQLQINHSDE